MLMTILIILLILSVFLLFMTMAREKKQKMAARGKSWSWTMLPPIRLLFFLMGLFQNGSGLVSSLFKRKYQSQPRKHEEPTVQISNHQGTVSSRHQNKNEPSIKTASNSDRKLAEERPEDPDTILGLKPQYSAVKTSHPVSKVKSVLPKRILIYLKAPAGLPYGGYDLLQTLLTHHFRFGEMEIFHRHEDVNGQGSILFSLAAATKMGTFDLANMGGFSCPGLTLFLNLSKQKNPLMSFDIMLETAYQLISDLGGSLLDEYQNVLSEEKIQGWGEAILQYNSALATELV